MLRPDGGKGGSLLHGDNSFSAFVAEQGLVDELHNLPLLIVTCTEGILTYFMK
jgi:hypothetical protein